MIKHFSSSYFSVSVLNLTQINGELWFSQPHMCILKSCETVKNQTELVFKINVQEYMNALEGDNRKSRVLQKTGNEQMQDRMLSASA